VPIAAGKVIELCLLAAPVDPKGQEAQQVREEPGREGLQRTPEIDVRMDRGRVRDPISNTISVIAIANTPSLRPAIRSRPRAEIWLSALITPAG